MLPFSLPRKIISSNSTEMLFSRDSTDKLVLEVKCRIGTYGNSEHFTPQAPLQKLNLSLAGGVTVPPKALLGHLALSCSFCWSYHHIPQEMLRQFFQYFIGDPRQQRAQVSPPRSCAEPVRGFVICGLSERLWGHLAAPHNQTGKVQT